MLPYLGKNGVLLLQKNCQTASEFPTVLWYLLRSRLVHRFVGIRVGSAEDRGEIRRHIRLNWCSRSFTLQPPINMENGKVVTPREEEGTCRIEL